MVHRPSASPAGQRTTAASCSPPVRLGRPPYIPDTGVIIHDLLWADLAKSITGWAENDCGVSDTNIICDLFWTDLATDIATWVGNGFFISEGAYEYMRRGFVEGAYEYMQSSHGPAVRI